MKKQEVKHPDRPDTSASPYSLGVACDGWLYVSGQGPLDLKTMQVVPGTIEEETRLTLSNVEKILEAGGCSFDDVVKCTCYLADIDDFDAFSRTYMEFFPDVRPARTTVGSKLWGGIKVEIDAIACISTHD
jgi:2-iminobutanoate/2-iminopropanoate deaminase